MSDIKIAALADSWHIREALNEILVEAVASGGSVSFMHPLSFETANSFWKESLASAGRGERVVLGAFDTTGWSEPSRCCSLCRRTSRTGPRSQK